MALQTKLFAALFKAAGTFIVLVEALIANLRRTGVVRSKKRQERSAQENWAVLIGGACEARFVMSRDNSQRH
ncbi:hypothetical protein EJ04DRAFT_512882 [Polyplosphaeria fusca]|uniref:Uncharacterized protein n=1 Tax=Polyplosphaeria fusca TaxID=682080 RepID=A0A9P4QU10_9PLEO|nr:hypothetical protein EJ04DRAFT_512882 [Polyplosphaeria fusca]